MQKRQKDLLRTLVSELRARLVGRASVSEGTSERGNLDRELERLGIAPDGSIKPIEALPGAREHERYAYGIVVEQLSPLPLSQRPGARSEIIERAAYTWINRLLALRAMEVRDLIDNTLRGEEAYGGISERLFVLRETQPERATGEDGGWWAVIEDACDEQARSLPGFFALDDPSAALRPGAGVLAQCIALVSGQMANFTQEESNATFADPDAIGWAYQFYQEESKANVDAKCKSGGKVVNRSELAAKTQLFTEPYMVQWLLQNSLGRSYHEAYPQSVLPTNWPYYVQPDQLANDTYFTLASLTLLDPCMGSGHFLRAAFDLFVEMYREQFPNWNAREIADRILSEHLHGIDLDPRAAQLTALTLYLRAWELVRDEHKEQRRSGSVSYIPPILNLATTPTNLNRGMLERHLKRHPQDELFKPLIEEIFAGLEQAEVLGSLLRPREYLDRAIADLQKLPVTQRGLFSSPGEDELRIQIARMAKNDPAALKKLAMERVIESFHAEAHNVNDIGAMLFGREAEQGVRLLQLLDRQYAVVVTNPPYMGSQYMITSLKKYIEKHYAPGKRDIYAAFILRCLELSLPKGRIAMVTMQSWMFLSSFSDLRSTNPEESVKSAQTHKFTGILRETSLDILAHLGTNAFEEISGDIVQSTMFVTLKKTPVQSHRLRAIRLVGIKNAREKDVFLQQESTKRFLHKLSQVDLQSIPTSPLSYWLEDDLLAKFKEEKKMSAIFLIKGGLSTTDNDRFVRYQWEISSMGRWFPYTKGGGYNRWAGNNYYIVDWGYAGARMKEYIMTIPGNTHWSRRIFNTEYYFKTGYTYSPIGTGTLAIRKINNNYVIGHKGPIIILREKTFHSDITGIYNTRIITYLLRALAPQIGFEVNHLLSLPIYKKETYKTIIGEISDNCAYCKQIIVASTSIIDQIYQPNKNRQSLENIYCISAYLLTCENFLEILAFKSYEVSNRTITAILAETGTPAAWYPLVAKYDILPTPPEGLDLPPLHDELLDYLAVHERLTPTVPELRRIQANLRALYEAELGEKTVEKEDNNSEEDEAEKEGFASGAHIPIPTETFLEKLSVKMQLHPISIYWLLKELQAEGARCKQEEECLLEDRLSVLVLRLLGHRWPTQIEAGEDIPVWAERSGIIPLVSGTGKATLAERLREQLRAEEGDLGAQKLEALLEELTNGLKLDEWLRREFFARHASQFKSRPVAWHLASTPGKASGKGKKSAGGIQRRPAFECILYYHVCSTNALARVRNEFVEPLIQLERSKIERGRHEANEEQLFADQDATSALASERVRELEEFAKKLQFIEEQGFACSELQKLLAQEPLDSWCGDGHFPPNSREELARNEEAWHVDSNDGVRVNIAPLQLADVLASNVLKPVDARKAVVDRARWRADERRWVRAGKLPRCGWMDERVTASQKWDDLEPQRIAEQHKLEQKRLLLQQGQTVDESNEQADEAEEEEVS